MTSMPKSVCSAQQAPREEEVVLGSTPIETFTSARS
jgi:hypothetical protein